MDVLAFSAGQAAPVGPRLARFEALERAEMGEFVMTAPNVGDPILVEIWSDFVCPFCYMGDRKLKAGTVTYGEPVEIAFRSFQLRPDLTPGSHIDFITMFAERRGLSPEQVRPMMTGVTAQAKALGLQLHFDRAQTTNTRRAHELAHFAKSRGREDEMTERLFKAYFTDGLTIGHIDTLADLAAEVGLDRTEAAAALRDKRFGAAVETDIEAAKKLGISAVPHILVDGAISISGGQEPEVFAAALAEARLARSKTAVPFR